MSLDELLEHGTLQHTDIMSLRDKIERTFYDNACLRLGLSHTARQAGVSATMEAEGHEMIDSDESETPNRAPNKEST